MRWTDSKKGAPDVSLREHSRAGEDRAGVDGAHSQGRQELGLIQQHLTHTHIQDILLGIMEA